MSVPQLFHFAQFEYPWALGPPDGRYLVRSLHAPEADPTHVVVLATLGAAERRLFGGRRRSHEAAPAPEPTPVLTARATIVDVAQPLADEAAGGSWLSRAGEDELDDGLRVLDRALHAFRVVSADPYVQPPGRRQALVARLGYGVGDEVADGRWTQARELPLPPDGGRRGRRARMLAPQARLAAVLGGRESALACEELVLRARHDLDYDRDREAALQLLVALDAAVAELAADAHARELAERLDELRGRREVVAAAAQAALSGELTVSEREAVASTVGRVEAALRARAAAAGP